jgi:hypothetical protein
VLDAHLEVKDLPNYRTMMGRYVAKNHSALGLRPPESAVDDRGAVWHKELAQPPAVSSHVSLTHVGGVHPSTGAGQDRTRPVGWLMVALPWLSLGFASCVPAVWAASQRRHDLVFRRRMMTFAAVTGMLSIGGFIVLVSGPTDASGTPAGPVSDAGGFIWFAATIVATIVAVIHRKPRAQLPGTAQELARRAEREQYRALIRRDPALACSIHVGRPERNCQDLWIGVSRGLLITP